MELFIQSIIYRDGFLKTTGLHQESLERVDHLEADGEATAVGPPLVSLERVDPEATAAGEAGLLESPERAVDQAGMDVVAAAGLRASPVRVVDLADGEAAAAGHPLESPERAVQGINHDLRVRLLGVCLSCK